MIKITYPKADDINKLLIMIEGAYDRDELVGRLHSKGSDSYGIVARSESGEAVALALIEIKDDAAKIYRIAYDAGYDGVQYDFAKFVAGKEVDYKISLIVRETSKSLNRFKESGMWKSQLERRAFGEDDGILFTFGASVPTKKEEAVYA